MTGSAAALEVNPQDMCSPSSSYLLGTHGSSYSHQIDRVCVLLTHFWQAVEMYSGQTARLSYIEHIRAKTPNQGRS